MNIFKKKINLDKVLVCIGKKSEDGRVCIPFVDDLEIYFVEDKFSAYSVIMEKDLKRNKITVEELYEKSKENVKNKIFSMYKEIPLQKNEEDEVLIPYDADIIIEKGMYNFWTSIVLIDEFWDKSSKMCIEKKWDEFYIALPYRTWLIIGNGKNEKSKKEIKELVDNYKKEDKKKLAQVDFEAGKRSISDNIYLMKNGKIHKVL